MKKYIILGFLIITTPFVSAQDLGNPGCDSLLLVSSWSRDNVKIYDGCDGSFIRDLAAPGVLDGPQAIFQDEQGDVVVVSESNHKLVKFDQASLSTATAVIDSGIIENPITAVKTNNSIYLGSYSSNSIIEVSTATWQIIRTILPAGNGQIQGIDIGMALGPDGRLYVPGYDSDNILRVDPANGSTTSFVNSGAQGLDRPRTVLFQPNRVLVTAYGNHAIFSYDLNGNFQGEVVSGFGGVAGMIQDGPDHILVTSDTISTVRRYNTQDFSFETLVPNRSGDLAGATYVYRLMKMTEEVDLSAVQQAWVTGVGTIDGNQILVNQFTTMGGAFGDDFDPADIEFIPWGEMLLEFTGCHTASMSYVAHVSVNGQAFGTGSYPLERLAMNPAGAQCDESGFAAATDATFMNGTFFGGAARNGEGFTIDYLNPNQAIVTWFTYLPANSTTPTLCPQ